MNSTSLPADSAQGRSRAALRGTIVFAASFLAIAIVAVLAFLPEAGGSGFDGFWLKTGGESWMSDQMKVTIKANVLTESFPGTSATVSFQLIADGREHAWFDPEEGESAEKTYTAQLTSDSFILVTHTKGATGPGGPDTTEKWSLKNAGKELDVTNREGQAVYRRASWLRRLFTHEP